jgi:hypothetical protein
LQLLAELDAGSALVASVLEGRLRWWRRGRGFKELAAAAENACAMVVSDADPLLAAIGIVF